MPEKKKQTKSKSESPELKAALKKAKALQEKLRLKRDKANRRDTIIYGTLIGLNVGLAILSAVFGKWGVVILPTFNALWMALVLGNNRIIHNQSFVIDMLIGINSIESGMLLERIMRNKKGNK